MTNNTKNILFNKVLPPGLVLVAFSAIAIQVIYQTIPFITWVCAAVVILIAMIFNRYAYGDQKPLNFENQNRFKNEN